MNIGNKGNNGCPIRPTNGNIIYVYGIGQANESDLYSLFSNCGRILRVNVIKNQKTGQCKGYGFVVFETYDEALFAVNMNGYMYNHRPLQVNSIKSENLYKFYNKLYIILVKLNRLIEYSFFNINQGSIKCRTQRLVDCKIQMKSYLFTIKNYKTGKYIYKFSKYFKYNHDKHTSMQTIQSSIIFYFIGKILIIKMYI